MENLEENTPENINALKSKFNNYANVKSVSQNFFNGTIIQLLIGYLFTIYTLNTPGIEFYRTGTTIVIVLELTLRTILSILIFYINNTKIDKPAGSCGSLSSINKGVTIMTGVLFFVSMITNYITTTDIKEVFNLLKINGTLRINAPV